MFETDAEASGRSAPAGSDPSPGLAMATGADQTARLSPGLAIVVDLRLPPPGSNLAHETSNPVTQDSSGAYLLAPTFIHFMKSSNS
jgi:hypothetical protein